MPEIKATLNIEVDGVSLSDFPIVRRIIFGEGGYPALQIFVPDPDTATFHPVPSITSPNVNVLFVSTDQLVSLDLNQLGAVPLTAGGFMIIFGTALQQATAEDNLTINNPPASSGGSGVNANVTVLNTGS